MRGWNAWLLGLDLRWGLMGFSCSYPVEVLFIIAVNNCSRRVLDTGATGKFNSRILPGLSLRAHEAY